MYFQGRLEIILWCWWEESNLRPTDYESVALPTELHQRSVHCSKKNAHLVAIHYIRMMLFKPATQLSVCVSVFPADAGNISGKILRSKRSPFTLAPVCHNGRFTLFPFFCLCFGSVFCQVSMVMKKSVGPAPKRTCWLWTYICHQPHIEAISESTCRIIKEHQCYSCKRRDILFRKVWSVRGQE